MLRNASYEVKVDPDTSAPETKALRTERAKITYEILKSNPLINPQLLTRYLLHELHGVQFDDMLVEPNLGQTQALNFDQFQEVNQEFARRAPQLVQGNGSG